MANAAGRALLRVALAAALLGALACAAGPRPPVTHALPAALRSYLPSPAPLAPASADAWSDLHRRLLAGEDPAALESEASALAAATEATALQLFRAEARLATGDAAGARALAAGGEAWQLQLVAGRAAEQMEDTVAAVGHYLRAAVGSELAAERVEALRDEASEGLAERTASALDRGQLAQAETWLARLVDLAPGQERTLELRRRVAEEAGDRAAELEALAALSRLHPEREDLTFRRAQLEIEGGDPSRALELLERLEQRHPDDPRLPREIARAKFRFRLTNVPQEVKSLVARPQLTRAEAARLLFWLVPEVRIAPAAPPPIATDLLDRPDREEILKVAALGLLQVDLTLHLFEPERPVRRAELFRALLERPGLGGPVACAGVASRSCAQAAACGLIRDPAECLPDAPVSGGQAVEWIGASVEAARGEESP